jgi:cytoskeletal protein RodZ
MSTTAATVPSPSGRASRAARKRRVSAIRHWIVAGAVTLFVTAWLLIAVVLVSGHDPVLSKSSSAAVSSQGVSSNSAGSSSSVTGSSSGSSGSSSGSSSQNSGGSISTRSS